VGPEELKIFSQFLLSFLLSAFLDPNEDWRGMDKTTRIRDIKWTQTELVI